MSPRGDVAAVASGVAPRGARDAPLASTSTRSKLDVLSSMGAIVASPEDAPSRRANDAPDDVEDSESDDDDDDDDRRGENVSELERRVEAVITRLRRDGPTLVFEKTTQKHRVTAELVSLVPSARAPAIVPRGSVRGLSAPTRSSMDSPAYAASWHQEPLMLRTRRDARGRRRAESPSETQTARKRRLGEPLDAEAVHNAPPASASPTRRWRTRRLAGDDLERRFSAKTSPPEEAALDKHARLLLWAQRVAAEKEDEESDEEGDSAAGAGDGSEPSEADVAVPTREVPRERPEGAVEKGGAWGEDAGDGPAAPGAESESYAGRVRLTVDWRGRTRVRSGHRPAATAGVEIPLEPGETCAAFVSRIVEMPLGVGDPSADTQLSWGNHVVASGTPMHKISISANWRLDPRAATPPDLTLSVPVGAVLTHPALRGQESGVSAARYVRAESASAVGAGADDALMAEWRAARAAILARSGARGASGGRADVKVSNPLTRPTGGSGSGGKKNPGGDHSSSRGSVAFRNKAEEAASLGLSNRALHPGTTDPKRMARFLREYGAVREDEPVSIVDVGSGDGQFVLGLLRAFPRACLCGIECQRDLHDAAVELCGRNAYFLCGTAEQVLESCSSAEVVLATTHNFDVSTVVHVVRVAASLPMVTHLVVGEARLCTPRCKTSYGPCCCFEPVGAEDLPTHWGNSTLPFTMYRRVVPWILERTRRAPRTGDLATLAKLDAGELDPHAEVRALLEKRNARREREAREAAAKAAAEGEEKGEEARGGERKGLVGRFVSAVLGVAKSPSAAMASGE